MNYFQVPRKLVPAGEEDEQYQRLIEAKSEDIILAHLAKFNFGDSISSAVWDCIREIIGTEGVPKFALDRQYRPDWNGTEGDRYGLLSDSLLQRFRNREAALEEETRPQRELAAREAARQQELAAIKAARQQELAARQQELAIRGRLERLRAKYAGLIARFYEVAERKVSLRDDYGDENWGALPKEIAVVVRKIAVGEGEEYNYDRRLEPEEYRQLANFLDSSFREAHVANQTNALNRADFTSMDGAAFESYLIKVLARCGFTNVCGTPASGDQGADLVVNKDGRRLVVQAKRYSAPVGNSAVQEVASAVHFYSADEGWVITNSTFTRSAKELAQKAGIKLIDGFELAKLADQK